MSLLKDIILWKYERASPQWDVLCVLILAFIFLTPKEWFNKPEKSATRTAVLNVKAVDFLIGDNVSEKHSEIPAQETSGDRKSEIIKRRAKSPVGER